MQDGQQHGWSSQYLHPAASQVKHIQFFQIKQKPRAASKYKLWCLKCDKSDKRFLKK